MLERCGYRAALYLSALIAIVHCSYLMYALWYLPGSANGVAFLALVAVAVSVGLGYKAELRDMLVPYSIFFLQVSRLFRFSVERQR